MTMVQRRILYAGEMSGISNTRHRIAALRRLGHAVIEFDMTPYLTAGSRLARQIRYRLQRGRSAERCNQDLRLAVEHVRPDIVWADKAVLVRRETVAALRTAGRRVVHYNPDNPFGPRRDGCWGAFLTALPEYDVHIVPRPSNLEEYRRAGAREVRLMPFGYEPTVHFPPPAGWSDRDRPFAVSFIGAPYDDRAPFIDALRVEYGINVHVHSGAWPARWRSRLGASHHPSTYGSGYRETIWKSRICLSFVTRSNVDTLARRTFEIAGCGGFLLAQRTGDHMKSFEEGREALFFDDVRDCAGLIHRFMHDEEARSLIAAAGRCRAEMSGYGNDARLAAVLEGL
ncbi:CgeB family protein [Rhodospirillum centenum]|uniref:Spore protein YkvP/CgeB glycosyl transferase-like domain-containing protein n=1 Tax=Rhodospirillum centenum (strain ATCC 51521 / SW) TaxID=414684 RepID=B6IYJ0_RHOCS|nr:glycosyltransferase [Rhodospirillum centenum]ACJ01364.1 conserved hypothetical protein [Rhodospirillum centenum SW]